MGLQITTIWHNHCLNMILFVEKDWPGLRKRMLSSPTSLYSDFSDDLMSKIELAIGLDRFTQH